MAINEFFPPNEEVMRDALSFLAKHNNNVHPNLEPIIQGFADETNTRSGAVLHLRYIEPTDNTSVDVGNVQFVEFVRDQQGWIANFKLLPEGTPCILPVERIMLSEVEKI